MPNPFISRPTVHEWSEAIGNAPDQHKAAFARLLKEQRRLTRFVEENAESLGEGTGGVALYLVGVIARMFDLAGGRMKSATWEQVRDAEARVARAAGSLLPVDEGFTARVRAVSKAQPHILDEAILALFDRPPLPDEPEVATAERTKILFLVWVAIEVLDACWRPPAGFAGEATYTYHHIEPKPLGTPEMEALAKAIAAVNANPTPGPAQIP